MAKRTEKIWNRFCLFEKVTKRIEKCFFVYRKLAKNRTSFFKVHNRRVGYF